MAPITALMLLSVFRATSDNHRKTRIQRLWPLKVGAFFDFGERFGLLLFPAKVEFGLDEPKDNPGSFIR